MQVCKKDACPCDLCGHALGALWYEFNLVEWLYPECKARQYYQVCEECMVSRLGPILWRQQAAAEFSDWVKADQATG